MEYYKVYFENNYELMEHFYGAIIYDMRYEYTVSDDGTGTMFPDAVRQRSLSICDRMPEIDFRLLEGEDDEIEIEFVVKFSQLESDSDWIDDITDEWAKLGRYLEKIRGIKAAKCKYLDEEEFENMRKLA